MGQPRECSEDKGHTSLGGIGMWGMIDCRLLVECAIEMEYFLLSMSLSLVRNHLPWVEFSPSSGVTHC